MHTRRISAFLLGAWILGCALMIYIGVESLETSHVLGLPPAPMLEIQKTLGSDTLTLLVRHIQSEQARVILRFWQRLEILIGLGLGGCLLLATQRRVFPLVLCGVMLILAVFQFTALSPEIAYRGREADFPPGNTNIGTVTRLLALQQVYFGVEVVKLISGGLLASYLFVFRASARRRSKDREPVPAAN